MHNEINAYDLDGTILDGEQRMLTPDWCDVIITGRGPHEIGKTLQILKKIDVENQIFFFPGSEEEKNHSNIALHKASVIMEIISSGTKVNYFFENELEQVNLLRKVLNPSTETKIIHISQTY